MTRKYPQQAAQIQYLTQQSDNPNQWDMLTDHRILDVWQNSTTIPIFKKGIKNTQQLQSSNTTVKLTIKIITIKIYDILSLADEQ